MAGQHTLKFDESNFETEVLQSTLPVLVDFWAPWCGPCQMVGPTIDELATEYAGRAKVGKVNVDEAGQLAGQYGIQSIPTVLIFVNGKVVKQMIGAKHKRDYKAALDAHVGAAR